MTLLDHSEMSEAELSTARSYAKLVPILAVEINNVLAKHGLKDIEIHSFSFGKKPGLITLKGPNMVQGIGLTKDGVWVVMADAEKPL
jgi:hypothetical protein